MKTTAMKTTALHTAGTISTAILLATGIAVTHPAVAAPDDIGSSAAHKLAYKFALQKQEEADNARLAANETAAQLAAERAAMKAAQAAAKAAREQAELKAYREDLLKRARREAAERRKAAAKRKSARSQTATANPEQPAKDKKPESLAESRIKAAQARAAARAKKRAAAKEKRRLAAAKAKAQAQAKARREAAALAQAEAKAKQIAAARAAAARLAKDKKLEEKRLAKQRLAKMQKERERELQELDRKLQRLKDKNERQAKIAARQAEQKAEADKKLAAARAADKKAAAERRAERHRLAAEKRAAEKIEKARLQRLSEQKLAEKRLREQRRLKERQLAEKKRIEKRLAARRQAAEQKRKSEEWRRIRLAEQQLQQRKLEAKQRAEKRRIAERRLAERRRIATRSFGEHGRAAIGARQGSTILRHRDFERSARLGTEERQWQHYFGTGTNSRTSAKSFHRHRLNEAMNDVERSARLRGKERDDWRASDSGPFGKPSVDQASRKTLIVRKRDRLIAEAETDPAMDRAPGWSNRYSVSRDREDFNDSIVRRRHSFDSEPLNPPAYQQAEPAPVDETGPVGEPGPATVTSRRATVLLVMRPGNRGIRRHNKTADPLLCTSGGCYISRGIDRPAKFKSRRRALGLRNTFGRRAGACNHRLGCIYRNVDLSQGSVAFQPVDLRMIRHDRRRRQFVSAPRYTPGSSNLRHCRVIYRAGNYEMIVIPEEVARNAGPAALQAMLDERMAVLNPRNRIGNVYGSIGYRR